MTVDYNSILVSWPLVTNMVITSYKVILTHPDGQQEVVTRIPETAENGGFSYLFDELQSGTTYTVELKVTDIKGAELDRGVETVVTLGGPTTPRITTTEVITEGVTTVTEGVTTQVITTQVVTTQVPTEQVTTAGTTQGMTTQEIITTPTIPGKHWFWKSLFQSILINLESQ